MFKKIIISFVGLFLATSAFAQPPRHGEPRYGDPRHNDRPRYEHYQPRHLPPPPPHYQSPRYNYYWWQPAPRYYYYDPYYYNPGFSFGIIIR